MFTTLISLALENLLYLALHIEGISSFPKPLSAADEKKYFDLYENGDINARNTLIEHNLRLVAHIVKKYYTVTNEQDDLISIGTIGLIKAVNTFSYDKGTRFATYASRCIENQILMHFRTAKKTTGDVYINDPCESWLVSRLCIDEDYIRKYAAHKRVYLWKIGKVITFKYI